MAKRVPVGTIIVPICPNWDNLCPIRTIRGPSIIRALQWEEKPEIYSVTFSSCGEKMLLNPTNVGEQMLQKQQVFSFSFLKKRLSKKSPNLAYNDDHELQSEEKPTSLFHDGFLGQSNCAAKLSEKCHRENRKTSCFVFVKTNLIKMVQLWQKKENLQIYSVTVSSAIQIMLLN